MWRGYIELSWGDIDPETVEENLQFVNDDPSIIMSSGCELPSKFDRRALAVFREKLEDLQDDCINVRATVKRFPNMAFILVDVDLPFYDAQNAFFKLSRRFDRGLERLSKNRKTG